ncbi:MAG: glycosyltransferase family 2 protein [Caldisericia bacterium]|nr:glycosyltransferase family 2 protein [Caldisericia bacterium]
MLVKVFDTLSTVIFVYFILICIQYIFLIIISFSRLLHFNREEKTGFPFKEVHATPISILIPAYNEETTICDTIKSLLAINYPKYEIVIVNDGSKDHTLKYIIDEFMLRRIDITSTGKIETEKIKAVYSSYAHPNILLVDKYNGGKADSLNAGINISRYPLFCSIDADSVIEKDSLIRMIKPFLLNENVVAVGGIVRVANGCEIVEGEVKKIKLPTNRLVRYQIIEYLRAFLSNRISMEKFNCLIIISGAFGLFKKDIVQKLDGYRKTIGEDMEITLRIHEYLRRNKIKYAIDFIPNAECWSQVPSDFKSLHSQRLRWQIGLIDSLMTHKNMLFNPRYGSVGLFAVPYYWFFEMISPVIEFTGYVIFIFMFLAGAISYMFGVVFLMALLFGFFFSVSSILMEELSYQRYNKVSEIASLILYSLFDQFWYRPMQAFFRLQAFFTTAKRKKSWGTIKRTAFKK